MNTSRIRRAAYRLISRLDSEGRCFRCGLSWNYRDPRWIRYHRDGTHAAPLCQQCFDDVDPVIATRYFRYLWIVVWGRELSHIAFGCFRTFMQYAIFDKRERGQDTSIDVDNWQEMRQWAM